MNPTWSVKRKLVRRAIIECPIAEAKDAIQWLVDNGYDTKTGWSGCALGKDSHGPTFDVLTYHIEGEKAL